MFDFSTVTLLVCSSLYLVFFFMFFTAGESSEIGQDLNAHAFKLWELLPAFCCYPTDMYKNFGALAKFLVSCTKEPSMLEIVAKALKVPSQGLSFLLLLCSIVLLLCASSQIVVFGIHLPLWVVFIYAGTSKSKQKHTCI